MLSWLIFPAAAALNRWSESAAEGCGEVASSVLLCSAYAGPELGIKVAPFGTGHSGKHGSFGTGPVDKGGSLPRHIPTQVMHGSTPPGIYSNSTETTA